jgi:exopolysaccharide production protein ExoQ
MQIRRIQWLDLCEYLFTLGTLFFTTGVMNIVLLGGLSIEVNTQGLNIQDIPSGPTQAPIFLVIQLGIFALTVLFMVLRAERYLKLMTRPRLVWIYVLLAMASCMWAQDGSASFRRSLFLWATTLFGFYFAGRYSPRQQIQMITIALGIASFTNLTFGLLFPAYAKHVMYFPGAWRGIMSHKNSLAQTSVLAASMFQILLAMPEGRKFWNWAGLLVSVLLVILTTSKTGLLALLLFSILFPMLRMLRAKRVEAQLTVLTIFLLLATIVALAVANYETLVLSLGRDLTFTGRTDIWAVLLDKVAKRPWLGYGFRAFWAGGAQGEAVDLMYRNNYLVDTAHNGFLDIALELGLVGLGIFLLSLSLNFRRGLQWVQKNASPEGLYPTFVMMYWLMYNLSESTLPDGYNISWVMYVAATTGMLIYRLPDRRARDLEHSTLLEPAYGSASSPPIMPSLPAAEP